MTPHFWSPHVFHPPTGGKVVAPVPVSSPLWPNEPAGMTPLFSPDPYQFPVAIPLTDSTTVPMGDGSGLQVQATNGPVGYQISDATQPVPGHGMQRSYANGDGPGGPATLYGTPANTQEMFTGLIHRLHSGWTLNTAPFPNEEAVGKFIEHWIGSGSEIIISWEYDDGSNTVHLFLFTGSFPAPMTDFTIRAADANSGSGTTLVTFVPGDWIRIQLYTKFHTTTSPANGVLQLWLSKWDGTTRDGSGNAVWSAAVLQVNRTDILYASATSFNTWLEYCGISYTHVGATEYQDTNVVHVSTR